jgi:elongation factor 1-alpha
MAEGKEHLSIVICGHVDSGKSTTTGRLLFELGGIPERELEKLKEEAAALGKQSFAFAFYMDRQKEERERGVTIACTTKEFFTDKWHYTIIDAPGARGRACGEKRAAPAASGTRWTG